MCVVNLSTVKKRSSEDKYLKLKPSPTIDICIVGNSWISAVLSIRIGFVFKSNVRTFLPGDYCLLVILLVQENKVLQPPR